MHGLRVVLVAIDLWDRTLLPIKSALVPKTSIRRTYERIGVNAEYAYMTPNARKGMATMKAKIRPSASKKIISDVRQSAYNDAF